MHSSRGVYPTSAAHDSKMAGRTHGWHIGHPRSADRLMSVTPHIPPFEHWQGARPPETSGGGVGFRFLASTRHTPRGTTARLLGGDATVRGWAVARGEAQRATAGPEAHAAHAIQNSPGWLPPGQDKTGHGHIRRKPRELGDCAGLYALSSRVPTTALTISSRAASFHTRRPRVSWRVSL